MRTAYAWIIILGIIVFPALIHSEELFEVWLVNKSYESLTLYIDGKEQCTAPAGDACAGNILPGPHVFIAKSKTGNIFKGVYNIPTEGKYWEIGTRKVLAQTRPTPVAADFLCFLASTKVKIYFHMERATETQAIHAP